MGWGLIPRKYYSSNDDFFFPEKHFSNTFPEFDESEKLKTYFPKQIARTLGHCVRVKGTQRNQTHLPNTFIETHLPKSSQYKFLMRKVPNSWTCLFNYLDELAHSEVLFTIWTCYLYFAISALLLLGKKRARFSAATHTLLHHFQERPQKKKTSRCRFPILKPTTMPSSSRSAWSQSSKSYFQDLKVSTKKKPNIWTTSSNDWLRSSMSFSSTWTEKFLSFSSKCIEEK